MLAKQASIGGPETMTAQCLSPKEVAALLGLSQRTVTRLLRAGDIAGFKVHDKRSTTSCGAPPPPKSPPTRSASSPATAA